MPELLNRIPRQTYVGVGSAVVIGGGLIAFGLSDALIIGLVGGATYALFALGLVMIYKSSGIFNFAQGEFGTVAIFVLWMMLERDTPYVLAIVVALAAAVLFGLAVERVIIRPLFTAPRVILLVGTAGVALLVIGVQFWLGGGIPRNLRPLLTTLNRVSPLGVNVSDQRMLLIAVMAVIAVGLAYFFNRTNLGLAVVAASQEPTAIELCGVSNRRLAALTWGLTALMGGVAGVFNGMIAGQFTPGFMTGTALIPGFTAAVLGGMTSLPGAFVGGAIVGVAQTTALSAGAFENIPGQGSVMIFVILLAVLVARPQGLLGKTA